jgi:hypothetical protein
MEFSKRGAADLGHHPVTNARALGTSANFHPRRSKEVTLGRFVAAVAIQVTEDLGQQIAGRAALSTVFNFGQTVRRLAA